MVFDDGAKQVQVGDANSIYKGLIEHAIRSRWARPEDLPDQDFVAEDLAYDLADDAGFALRLAQFALVGGDGKHVAEFHLLLIAAEFLHPDDVPGRDAILLPPGADDRVHKASIMTARRLSARGPSTLRALLPRRQDGGGNP
jgi:hypothetical protein